MKSNKVNSHIPFPSLLYQFLCLVTRKKSKIIEIHSGLRAAHPSGTCFCYLKVRVGCEYKQIIVPQHDKPVRKIGIQVKVPGQGESEEVTLDLSLG